MKILKILFPVSLKDTLITVLVLAAAGFVCSALRLISDGDIYVSMIFLLAVLIVSRYTDGYFYGTTSSILSVFCINFVFTYPYMKFNFSIPGYPIAFLSMLVVSIITCTMTTRLKEQEKLKAEAEKEKARSNLLRAVSHDLRTPLTSILGAASVVIENEERLTREKRMELLRDIRNDAQWLIRMVENLLSVTRIGEGAAKIRKNPEATEEIVAEAVEKYERRFAAGGRNTLPVTVSVPDELLMVPMDALLIEQVISNLLENAALHAEGATRVCLTVKEMGSEAEFEVTDNGAGIDPDKLERIFDGYMNRENTGVDGVRNMGIGLSVCKSIIKAHGGRMTAENTPNGAKFTFTLPL